MNRWKLTAVAAVIVVALIVVAAAMADKPRWFADQEHLSDRIASQQIGSVPYPEGAMKDSLERRNLRERLLRFNKAQKVGYVYIMSFGKFVGYYVIKGKLTSTQSQMTNTNQTFDSDGGSGHDQVVVDSIGDDGSFGPNEGGDKGVFFFTSNGTMVETTLDWVYSDTPLNIDVPNLLSRKK